LIDPDDVRLWVTLDVHKYSIAAATLPPKGGTPEVSRIETAPKAIRHFIDRLGGPAGLAVCYEAESATLRSGACSPTLASPATSSPPHSSRSAPANRSPRRQEARLVHTRRPAPPRLAAERRGRRAARLLRCRDDLRRARTAARHRVVKQLCAGRILREGKKSWTKIDRAWQAQLRLHHHLDRSRQAVDRRHIAIGREFVAFLWAVMSEQPMRREAITA
jgi:hypothetical protein